MYDKDYFFQTIAKGSLLLRLKDVAKITGLSKSVIEYHQKNDEFPKCVKLGKKTVAIRTEELWHWYATRKSAEL